MLHCATPLLKISEKPKNYSRRTRKTLDPTATSWWSTRASSLLSTLTTGTSTVPSLVMGEEMRATAGGGASPWGFVGEEMEEAVAR
jgi:hypothetical protein